MSASKGREIALNREKDANATWRMAQKSLNRKPVASSEAD